MKVFLAATSDKSFLKDVYAVDYLLESFYYFKEWQLKLIKNCKMFLLDSGAFTFMNNTKKGNINWKKYIDNYIDFINKNNIEYFFELDIDVIVGYENVKKIRKYIEEKTNKKCIPVWHKQRGIEEWINLTKEYNYVAIGGIVTKEITKQNYKYFPYLLNIAKKNNCKVHGLGFTATRDLKKYKFDTVDSTNWKSGGRFGQLHIFNGKYIESKSFKDKRAKDYKMIDEHNLKEWIKFQKYAKKYL